MDRVCIFCGRKPQSKSREHVIPQWLMRLTGDPNRRVSLGIKWSTPKADVREFSLNSFCFPACADCNGLFSALEGRAETIVRSILDRSPLTSDDWDVLLDWLDKIRIGLWLGYMYLNENHLGIRPQFHITGRTGSKDRMVVVYQIMEDGLSGVWWGATESPLFGCVPCCFTLTINNFSFLNISRDFLFVERFGFPYASRCMYLPSGGMTVEMMEGTQVLRFPLYERGFKTGGTQLFQPMIPYRHIRSQTGEQVEELLYDNPYVRSKCMHYDSGRGKVFRRNRSQLEEYPAHPSLDWLPKQKFRREEVLYESALTAFAILKDFYLDFPSFDHLEEEEADDLRERLAGPLKMHEEIVRRAVESKHKFL